MRSRRHTRLVSLAYAAIAAQHASQPATATMAPLSGGTAWNNTANTATANPNPACTANKRQPAPYPGADW